MISYVPHVRCAKCNQTLKVRRVTVKRGGAYAPTLFVACHGEEAEVPFAISPDEKVELWVSGT